MSDLTPCGDDRLDCIDCCGYGVCEFTKDKDINDKLAEVFKDIFGIYIRAGG